MAVDIRGLSVCIAGGLYRVFVFRGKRLDKRPRYGIFRIGSLPGNRGRTAIPFYPDIFLMEDLVFCSVLVQCRDR